MRHNAADTIKAAYTYTYDDGDNLVTKVEPWADDFADGSITDDGWTVNAGTWGVAGGAAQNTSSSSVAPAIQFSVADDDVELRYAYTFDSVTSGVPQLEARVRSEASNFISVVFLGTKAQVWRWNSGVWTFIAENTSFTSSTGTKYDVRIALDGANLKVWRSSSDYSRNSTPDSGATTGPRSPKFLPNKTDHKRGAIHRVYRVRSARAFSLFINTNLVQNRPILKCKSHRNRIHPNAKCSRECERAGRVIAAAIQVKLSVDS